MISLVLDKHFNKLFVNLPVRHVYRQLGHDDIATEALLDDLVWDSKITNFFILARYDRSCSVLLKCSDKPLPVQTK